MMSPGCPWSTHLGDFLTNFLFIIPLEKCFWWRLNTRTWYNFLIFGLHFFLWSWGSIVENGAVLCHFHSSFQHHRYNYWLNFGHLQPIEVHFIPCCYIIVNNSSQHLRPWGGELWEHTVLWEIFWNRACDLVISFNMSTMVYVVYYPFISLPPSLYVDTPRELFHSIWPTVGTEHQWPFGVAYLLRHILQCLHWLCPWLDSRVCTLIIFLGTV